MASLRAVFLCFSQTLQLVLVCMVLNIEVLVPQGLELGACNTQSLGRLKRGLRRRIGRILNSRACIPYIEVMQVALRTRFGQEGGNGAYHNPAYAQVTQEDDCPYCLMI